MAYELKFPNKIQKRIDDNKIIEQKIWSFIEELNSFDDEHLDAVAIYDGYRKYTYRQMFRKWNQYAEVFSALEITGENGSRVGLLPDFASEPLFALYALNMTGASVSLIHCLDLMDVKRWDKMIEKEGITDLVVCDTKITPGLLKRVIDSKEELGIRNIIVLHNTGKNKFDLPGMQMKNRENYRQLKKLKGILFMNELLEKYEAFPITLGSKHSRDDAVIMHTSGTTNGVHKPVPLSDRGFNEAVARLMRSDKFKMFCKRVVCLQAMEITSAYALIDMVHLPFAFGGGVIIIPFGSFNPVSLSLIKEYDVNIFFSAPPELDRLIKLPFKPDLSSIEFVFVGGSYASIEQKERFNKYLKKCGSKARISIGYGATETGGAVILSSSESDDDSMGVPLPGVKVKIFDEIEEKYYNLEDGSRTGGLLISSPSVSSGKLNEIEFFGLEDIDGEKYYNTYDLVTVNENGTLKSIGRMNKFFVNNEGIRFDAGLIETAISSEPGISSCGLAPIYDKMLHDTVPVLYVQTSVKGNQKEEVVKKALEKVFITDRKIEETNLPAQCVITKNIPYNAGGKVDIYRIKQGEGNGQRYDIIPVRRFGKTVAVRLRALSEELVDRTPDNMGAVPDELRYDLNLVRELLGGGLWDSKNSDTKTQGNCPMFNMPDMFNMPNKSNIPNMSGIPNMPGMPNVPLGINLQQIIAMLQNIAMQQNANIDRMYNENAGQTNSSFGYGQSCPGYFMPGCGMPVMGMPVMGMPNMGMPNMGMPNMGMPNMGMPNTGMPNMGMPQQWPFGMNCGQFPMQNGYMDDNDADEDVDDADEEDEDASEDSKKKKNYMGSPMSNPFIKNIMRMLFNASQDDKYYED